MSNLKPPVEVTQGGTGGITASQARTNLGITDIATQTVTEHSVLVGGAADAITSLTVGTTGQLLVGATGADPAFGSSANADFTFGGANSGATRTLTISNTSDTASSAANVVATVGGTSAADATYQAVVSGTTTWTWGVDNSDSDAFVIAASSALGTTNVMRIATTGEITCPLQPAFQAYANGDITNVTGDGTVYTCAFNTESFDQNGDFASNTFTAPVTGRYQLTAMVSTFNNTAAVTTHAISIVTSNTTYPFGGFTQGLPPASTAGTSAVLGKTVTMLCDMDAADTATITWRAQGTTLTIDFGANSFFAGFLAC